MPSRRTGRALNPSSRSSPLPSPATKQADAEDQVPVAVSLTMSRHAAERLRAFRTRGNNRFVVSSPDGALSVKISMVMARRSSTEEIIPGLGDAAIDWDRGSIERDGRRTTLSRTVLRIFACLLENAGKPVAHDQLITSAWSNTPDDAGYNALAVYICYLRRSLKQIGLGQSLKTVRGIGYMLAVEPPREVAQTPSRSKPSPVEFGDAASG